MANYISVENNTPLDIEKLEKGYSAQIGEIFQTSSNFSQGMLSNGLVILSVVIFVLTLVYATQGQFLTTGSRAANIPTPAAPTPKYTPLLLNNIVTTLKDYPTYYRDVAIAADIYEDLKNNYDTSTPGKKNFMIDSIVRYYVYREKLQEQGIPYTRSEHEGAVANMLEEVDTMELLINERIIKGENSQYKTLDELVDPYLIHFK